VCSRDFDTILTALSSPYGRGLETFASRLAGCPYRRGHKKFAHPPVGSCSYFQETILLQSKILFYVFLEYKKRHAPYGNMAHLNGMNGSFTNTDDHSPSCRRVLVTRQQVCDLEILEFPGVCETTKYALCRTVEAISRAYCAVELVQLVYNPEGEFQEALIVTNLSRHVLRRRVGVELLFSLDLVVPSQLNGSHGEWTNSDDVDDMRRVRKEARNKQKHSSLTPHKKKTGELPMINKPCREFQSGGCVRANCRFIHEMLPVELPPPESGSALLEGEPVVEPEYIHVFDNFGLLDGKPHYSLPGTPGILGIGVTWARMGGFFQFSRSFGSRELIVSKAMYEQLFKKLGILADESRNYAALIKTVRDLFEGYPPRLMDDIVEFFAYKNSTRSVPNNSTDIIRNTTYSFACGMVRILQGSYSPGVDYKWNMSWRIVGSNGFAMDIESDMTLRRRPEFLTSKEVQETSSTRRALFMFSPYNAFQYYSNTGVNVCNALSRYFKARPNESTMKEAQLQLCSGFDPDILRACAHMCGARIAFDNGFLNCVTFRPVTRSRGPPIRQNFVVSSDNSFALLIQNLHSRSSTFIWQKLHEYLSASAMSVYNAMIDYVYTPFYWLYDRADVLRVFVQIPHPKRLLYTKYASDESTLDRIIENSLEFESKFKNEAGKVGKDGRLYATINEGTLVDTVASDLLKVSFKTPLDFVQVFEKEPWFMGSNFQPLSYVVEFSDTQDSVSSDSLYNKLNDLPENSYHTSYFSDDGISVHRRDGGTVWLETDISSCDASNGFALFAAVKQLGALHGVGLPLDQLLVQCSRATTVRNPCNREEFLKLLPMSFFEYSGTRLTTVLNNFASLAIALGTFRELCETGGGRYSVALTNGALRYGWVLTVEQKKSSNAVTFLKRAFNGRRSWLVYGCILRSFGIVNGTLTPQAFGLEKKVFEGFNYSQLTDTMINTVADSLVNEPPSLLTNAILERCGRATLPEELSISDLQDRYGGEYCEWSELYTAVSDLRFGDVIRLPILESIFSVDYGVSPVLQGIVEPDGRFLNDALNVF